MYVLIGNIYPKGIVGNMTGIWVGIGTFGGVLGLYLGGLTLNLYGNYQIALLLMSLSSLVGVILVFIMGKQKTLR